MIGLYTTNFISVAYYTVTIIKTHLLAISDIFYRKSFSLSNTVVAIKFRKKFIKKGDMLLYSTSGVTNVTTSILE